MPHIVDLDTVMTTAQVAAEFGLTARRVRQVSARMGLGYHIGGVILFTPEEVEQMRHRRTDRTPIRCWLRLSQDVPGKEESEKTRDAQNEINIDHIVKSAVLKALNRQR